MRIQSKLQHSLKLVALLLLPVALLVPVISPFDHVSAISGSNFNAGNIISDAVFTNYLSMSVSSIQGFLNSQVPSCDNNGSQPYNSSMTHAQYDASIGENTQFTCLSQYYENPSTHANNLDGNAIPSGAESAAQIIYNAAQSNQINPQVILVTLQKEQGLVTDSWPWDSEYTEAMGYACPDSGSTCVSQYSGFYNQVNNAAWQYRQYLNNPEDFNYVVGNNTIAYSPTASCGNSVVNIVDQSTAALYDYTPYQPNAAALATVSNSSPGSSVNCGSYGNRNFWWYFNTWFGSSQVSLPYAWTPVSQSAYTDSGYTTPFTNQTNPTLSPGQKAYLKVIARNNGNNTWSQSVVHLGTTYPRDRASVFDDGTWLSPGRIQMQESSVSPGATATFEFPILAPSTPGTYVEHFSLVADGITWLNDPDVYYTIDVVNPVQASNTQDTGLSTGQSINVSQHLLSPDTQSTLSLMPNGNLILFNSLGPVWSDGVNNTAASDLVLQSDGNLVEYDNTGHPLWATGTTGTGNYLALQTDGNLVLYSSSGSALWSTSTGSTPNHLSQVIKYLPMNGVMYPGQALQTADRKYTLVLQSDGNLVEYNSTGHPVWSTGTIGSNNILAMQSDGNLVMYAANGSAIWSSGTVGIGTSLFLQPDGTLALSNGGSGILWRNRALGSGQSLQTADRAYTLVMQSDGNLVEYDSSGNPLWASATVGGGNFATMQSDGNLVIYSWSGKPLWSSGTGGKGTANLTLQEDGNLVIYGGGGPLWADNR